MKTDLLYASLVAARNTELTIYWARYNIQAILNFGLLAATMQAPGGSLLNPIPRVILGAGIFLALTWFGLTIMGKRLLEQRWQTYIRRCEERIVKNKDEDEDLLVFTDIAKREAASGWWKREWNNLTILTSLVPLLCLIAWVLVWWRTNV